MNIRIFPAPPAGFSATAVRELVEQSRALFAEHGLKINVLYLHAPDRGTPIEETLKALNDAHKAGALCVPPITSFVRLLTDG